MVHRVYPLVCCLFVAALSGCGQTEPPQVAPPAESATPPANTPAPPAADAPSPEAAKSPAAPQPVAQFSPPFPERDLFVPPKRAQGTVRRDDEGETVELKGFVNVDQPKVVLAIDGVISPIAEGGEKYGVHVISIQPPSVVLQRGRNRWTATLE
jgi:hypothetical protein